MRRVVITGAGAVTPFGVGRQIFSDAIQSARSAAALITQFDVSALPTRFAAQLPLGDTELDQFIENRKSTKNMSRAMKFAVIAAHEAVDEAGLDTAALDPGRTGTSIGAGGLGLRDLSATLQNTKILSDSIREQGENFQAARMWRNTLDRMNPLTPLKELPNMAAAHIAINHHARGPSLTLSTACVASSQAIGEAYRQIKFGLADVMLAGGSDSMTNPTALVGFSALGVLSRNNEEYRTAARPFDRRREGFMLGEGGAILVLEDYDACLKRGGVPYAEIIGYGTTCDAYRLTDEPPEAWGSIDAMRLALAESGLNAEEVDYINAHGTGTQMNDKTETMAIKAVFAASSLPPVSSTKSMIGHLVAAAGAVEAAACLSALEKQFLPPTINYEHPDPDCDLDYVPNEARDAPLKVVMSNSFGFGGQNSCLLFRSLR
ncbi:MAG: beta-ketoacyl-[acyl-carrier-protein] synthase family protein [Gammaproteobacteria bacterium]|nr:beta-ketoacyl-[acyl-carrier-protein] synthase family protein [Gammaproteobacteria bacterium]